MSLFDKEQYYGSNVTKLLPHQHPFVLISHLVEMVGNRAITQFKIPKDHLLIENGYLSETGLLENLAQTAALSAGFAYFTGKEPEMGSYQPPMGYMGSIKKIQIQRIPHYSEKLETRTVLLKSIKSGQTEVVFCIGKISSGAEVLAHGEFKLFLIYPE
ncbi:MAG: hypothetical protein CL840_09695 [Crocinitomicaceae bacterium]|nr:hypothetical protein [Crocinitomicaceae bacterium]|tara:strand:+ start:190 stop:663 length:474 start_codon:yes stop_codon:yes gene_type:complete